MTLSSLKKALAIFTVFALVGTEIAASQTTGSTGNSEGINQVDANGKRQGFWRINGPVKNKPDYASGTIYEEGYYVDSKKNGVWKRFWPNGKILSEIEYVDNRPMGAYKVYRKDGTIEERGNWQYNTNTGDYNRYHENGNVSQDFKFNKNGLRSGEQKYYHENGQLAVNVTVENGKEQGTLNRYYDNGDLKASVVFNNGKVDASRSKWMERKEAAPAATAKPTKPAPKVNSGEKVNEAAHFKHNGRNTLYNKDRLITQTGEFRNGQLYNGKVYKRNQNGILYKIEVYREGAYVGDGIIGPDDY